MHLSLVIFDSPLSLADARQARLIGKDRLSKLPLFQAMASEQGPGVSNVGGKSVLTWPRLFPELTQWEKKIAEASAGGSATLLTLNEELKLFGIVRWEKGQIVRQHVAFESDYYDYGAPLPIETAILKGFTPKPAESGVSFVSSSGDSFDAMQVGDALVNAVLEQELGEPEQLAEHQVQLYEPAPADVRARQEMEPVSKSGGMQLLRTLVSKGQLELAPDANLRKMDLGMEPFLDPKRDSYEAANALIDWLVDQPGVEEVYIEPEHLAKLLARW